MCPLRKIYRYASCIWPGALPEKKQIELFSKFILCLLPSKMFKISFYTYPRDNGENNDNDNDNDKDFI